MHKTGWYLDFRIVCTPSLNHEIPKFGFQFGQLRKKIWGYSELGPQIMMIEQKQAFQVCFHVVVKGTETTGQHNIGYVIWTLTFHSAPTRSFAR